MKLEKFVNILSNIIIPGDKNKGIIYGSEVNFINFLEKNNKLTLVYDYQKEIENSLKDDKNLDFNSISDEVIHNTILKTKRKNFRILNEIAVLLCECYYSNINALEKLSLPTKPPFPDGNYIQDFDLSILEVVFNRGRIYKK